MLQHLTSRQTLALFAFAFLEMLAIRALARTDAVDGAAAADGCSHAELADPVRAAGTH